MPLTESVCYELLNCHYDERLEKKRKKLKELKGPEKLKRQEKLEKLEKEIEIHLRHTEGVVSICREIWSGLPQQSQALVNGELLVAAAVLHDVAKFDEKKGENNHHELAGGVISSNRAMLRSNIDGNVETLSSIVKAHKGTFEPNENCACEAAILRMADKIDMLRRGKDKQQQFDDGIERITDYFQMRFQNDSEEVRFLFDFLSVVRGLLKEPS